VSTLTIFGVQLESDGLGHSTILGPLTVRVVPHMPGFRAEATERNRHGGSSIVMRSMAHTERGALSDLERKMWTVARIASTAEARKKKP
jgi:hypothetical protein